MRRVCALLLMLLGASQLLAADDIKCNDGGTQQELNACARDSFNKADKELNAAYQGALQTFAQRPRIREKLRIAQRAWLRYRDAEVAAMFACESDTIPCWGSMLPLDLLGYEESLTRARIEQIEALVKQHGK